MTWARSIWSQMTPKFSPIGPVSAPRLTQYWWPVASRGRCCRSGAWISSWGTECLADRAGANEAAGCGRSRVTGAGAAASRGRDSRGPGDRRVPQLVQVFFRSAAAGGRRAWRHAGGRVRLISCGRWSRAGLPGRRKRGLVCSRLAPRGGPCRRFSLRPGPQHGTELRELRTGSQGPGPVLACVARGQRPFFRDRNMPPTCGNVKLRKFGPWSSRLACKRSKIIFKFEIHL
jgi:hypothetical protein